MNVIITFYFSFPNSRIRHTHNATNIKDIYYESSINIKNEAYTFSEQYTTRKEVPFRKSIESYLNKHVRRNPSVTKCIFKCDYVPNRQVSLNDEFNRKLTKNHVNVIAKEIALIARRRFKNPSPFND